MTYNKLIPYEGFKNFGNIGANASPISFAYPA